MELVSKLPVPSDLSWLHVSTEPRGSYHVYGIHEDTGHVSRLRISADLSGVTVLQTSKLPGGGPAHVLVDEEKVYHVPK